MFEVTIKGQDTWSDPPLWAPGGFAVLKTVSNLGDKILDTSSVTIVNLPVAVNTLINALLPLGVKKVIMVSQGK